MQLTEREKHILVFALQYMLSNVDDINEMLVDVYEEEADEFTEEEVERVLEAYKLE